MKQQCVFLCLAFLTQCCLWDSSILMCVVIVHFHVCVVLQNLRVHLVLMYIWAGFSEHVAWNILAHVFGYGYAYAYGYGDEDGDREKDRECPGYIPRCRIAGLQGVPILHLYQEMPNCFPIPVPIYIHTDKIWEFWFLHILSSICYC